MTLASRITGFIRDTLLAILFGAGFAMDAFVVAFRIPNLLRRLFAEGAFSQAFVPVLGEYRAKNGDAKTREFSAHVLGLLAAVLFVATLVGIVATPLIVWLTASGFAKDADRCALTVAMPRVCFPYILFISLVSFASGLLNTYGSFKAPAFTPVLLNLSFIGFALWAAPHFERPIMALAWAVFAGGLAQLLFQIPFLKRVGMLAMPRWGPRDEAVVRVLKLMAPAALGVLGIIFVKILAPGFYAKQDIRTPVKVAIATLVVTQLFNAALVPWLRHAGLGLSISLGATFNAAWLWYLMRRSGVFRPEPGWAEFVLKLAVALYLMGGVIWYGMGTEASWFEITTSVRVVKLTLVILGATAAYFASLALM